MATESGYFTVGNLMLPYSIERSKRRRRTIGMMIGKEGRLRILAPTRTGLSAIEKLVYRQQNWIRRRVADYHARQATVGNQNSDAMQYLGKMLPLRFAEDRSRPQGCRIEEDGFHINVHDPAPSPEARQEEARLEMLLWYKKQARALFVERMNFWSAQLHLRYRSFAVSNPKRLWGSCSGRNDVRINWRLIMAPPELLDYVIVHELCHIPQKNHSKRFWRLVEQAIPDWNARRKKLQAMVAILDW